ncbi:MAG: TolC family protein [Rhodothermales bacterium]|nr:TolC family protein [Rhodothermales bacterium]
MIRSTPLVAVLLFAVAFSAQVVTAQETIRFEDAINIALDKNIDLQKAANQLELQRSNVLREKGDFLPNLNLSTRPNRSWGLTFDQNSSQLISERSDLISFGANSSMTIFNGFDDMSSYASAKYLLEADEYAYDRAQQTVFFNVIQAYLQVILDQEQVQIRTEDVESQAQQLARIQEFTRLGARPISDLYQQEAATANSELLLLEAERAVQLSDIRLIQVLELDPLQDYSFIAPPSDSLALGIVNYDLDALLARSLESRLDRMALRSEIAAASQDIRSAKSSRYPTVNASAGASTSYFSLRQQPLLDANGAPIIDSEGNVVTETIPFGDQFSDNRNWSVGFNVSVPIFNGFQVRNAVDRAKITHRNRALDLQNLEQNIALEVRQAYLDYQTSAKRLDVTEKQLRSATQAIDVEQERYNVGASTLVELQQARASFVDAASQRAQAVFQFVFQSRVIDYYLGVLDPQDAVIR